MDNFMDYQAAGACSDLPTINSMAMVGNTYNCSDLKNASAIYHSTPSYIPGWEWIKPSPEKPDRLVCAQDLMSHIEQETKKREKKVAKEPKMRLVRVLIADPDERLPLESRMLVQGEEKLTDETDEELFFGINMQEALKNHNVLRMRTIDKKASEKVGRDVLLEPIKIRDLVMTVVTVAAF